MIILVFSFLRQRQIAFDFLRAKRTHTVLQDFWIIKML